MMPEKVLMTEKEFNVFSLITTVLVVTSLFVGVSAHNEVGPTDNAAKPKTAVESSHTATGIYAGALALRREYDAWELVQENASKRGILLLCGSGSKDGDCVKFWSKLADDQFIIESLRIISQGKITIVFSGTVISNGKDLWELFEVSSGGMVYIPMSATVEDIKKHLRSKE